MIVTECDLCMRGVRSVSVWDWAVGADIVVGFGVVIPFGVLVRVSRSSPRELEYREVVVREIDTETCA